MAAALVTGPCCVGLAVTRKRRYDLLTGTLPESGDEHAFSASTRASRPAAANPGGTSPHPVSARYCRVPGHAAEFCSGHVCAVASRSVCYGNILAGSHPGGNAQPAGPGMAIPADRTAHNHAVAVADPVHSWGWRF